MKIPSGWWRGERGEWYVVVQVVLFAVVVLGPRTLPGLPAWPGLAFPAVWQLLGAVAIAAGLAVSVFAAFNLGAALTPLPHPKDEARLVVGGLYRFVRHPIYFGVILMAFGWAVFVRGWLTLAYAVVLIVFFDIKSRREEQWLRRKFPEYAAYQRRVRRLIPFVY